VREKAGAKTVLRKDGSLRQPLVQLRRRTCFVRRTSGARRLAISPTTWWSSRDEEGGGCLESASSAGSGARLIGRAPAVRLVCFSFLCCAWPTPRCQRPDRAHAAGGAPRPGPAAPSAGPPAPTRSPRACTGPGIGRRGDPSVLCAAGPPCSGDARARPTTPPHHARAQWLTTWWSPRDEGLGLACSDCTGCVPRGSPAVGCHCGSVVEPTST